MRVHSLFIGKIERHQWQGKDLDTAIYKKPESGPLSIGFDGFDGDEQGDKRFHGGAYKAVYSYDLRHYDYWKNELTEVPVVGAFGENITTEGLDESQLCLGDEVRVGSALLQVNQPRFPCSRLAFRFGTNDIIKQFLKSERYGVYYRVLEPGEVSVDSKIAIEKKHRKAIPLNTIAKAKLDAKDLQAKGFALEFEDLDPVWKKRFQS